MEKLKGIRDVSHPPKLVAFSAPSGTGKSTICQKLIERNPHYKISISATTRQPRSYEKDTIHYFFLSHDDFFEKVKNGEFVEYEEVHGNYYGTLSSSVEQMMADGFTVLFDIDVYGALTIKEKYPDALLIFILPPSLEELKQRLLNRQSDSEAEIEKRLRRLPREIEAGKKFDINIVNSDLEETVTAIETIIRDDASSISSES